MYHLHTLIIHLWVHGPEFIAQFCPHSGITYLFNNKKKSFNKYGPQDNVI